MTGLINYYGQEIHIGDYLWTFHGYSIVKVVNILEQKDGKKKIVFWTGWMIELSDGKPFEKMKCMEFREDDKVIYKIEPNEEIEHMFSIKPTDHCSEAGEEFERIRDKYFEMYYNIIKEKLQHKRFDEQ